MPKLAPTRSAGTDGGLAELSKPCIAGNPTAQHAAARRRRLHTKKKKKKMCLTLACRRLVRTSSLRPTGGGIVALSVDLSG